MAVANKQSNDVGPDISTWLTRIQASDLLGVSTKTLKNWEERGILHPRMRPGTKAERGHLVVVYDPHEVAALPTPLRKRAAARDNPDECAALAFEMFDRGAKLRDVVVKLRKRPEEIERLHEQWLNLGGADLVINEAAHAELARWFGPFASVTEHLEHVRAMLGVATIEATVPDNASDEQIERAIVRFLDEQSSRPLRDALGTDEDAAGDGGENP